MTRILLLALTLVFPAAWLQSQDAPHTGSSQTQTPASGQTALEGCLQGSDGNYTLTDKHGRTYQLLGATSKLAAHVGHEVLATTTTPASIAISSAVGAEATAAQQPILDITQVKHISATCQTAASKRE
jgi:hypothetical protein